MNPKATASAYIQSRNLKIAKKYFSQSVFFYNNNPHTTVRFEISQGVYWERIINDKSCEIIGRKANFSGSYVGDVLQSGKIDEAKPVFVCEGIFDAIALQNTGLQAVSAMSCNNYPSNFINSLSKETPIIYAFDNDKAGIKAAQKFMLRTKKEKPGRVVDMIVPSSNDWNNELQQHGNTLDKFILMYLLESQQYTLDLAKKGFAMFLKILRTGIYSQHFIIEHRNCYYSFALPKASRDYDPLSAVKHLIPNEPNFIDILECINSDVAKTFAKIFQIKQISNFKLDIKLQNYNSITGETYYEIDITNCNKKPSTARY